MDNNKLLTALEGCENRLVDALIAGEVTDPGYHLMAETLSHIRGLAQLVAGYPRNPYREPITYDLRENKVAEWQPEPSVTVTPVEEPTPEPTPEPEPVKETPKPEPAPAPAMTKDEVKAICIRYANQGVDVSKIIESMGSVNISGLPVERYAELAAKVKEAAGEK